MKHIIEEIKIGEKKEGKSQKTGKDWVMFPVGIKIKGKWHNQNIFGNEIEPYKELKSGDEFECDLYQDEYNGKQYDKFKVLSQKEQKEKAIEEKLDRIIKGVELIYKKLDNG